jgi:hypothetical protein
MFDIPNVCFSAARKRRRSSLGWLHNASSKFDHYLPHQRPHSFPWRRGSGYLTVELTGTKQDRQFTYTEIRFKALWTNHYCRWRAVVITYFECVCVALVIQHAERVRRVILSSVTCLAPSYFSTLSHTRHDIRGEKYRIKICVDFLYYFSEIFFFLKKIQEDIIIKTYRSSCEVVVVLVRF